MTARPWLPYAVWAGVVGVIVLIGQPGFSYCATLHPRLCATALIQDVQAPWDAGQGMLVAAAVAMGWAVAAAWQSFGRSAGTAFGAWALVIGGATLFVGGRVDMCLGPLGVTPETCRAARGLPPETAWDRFVASPAPLLALLVIGWVAILLALRITGAGRQRGGL